MPNRRLSDDENAGRFLAILIGAFVLVFCGYMLRSVSKTTPNFWPLEKDGVLEIYLESPPEDLAEITSCDLWLEELTNKNAGIEVDVRYKDPTGEQKVLQQKVIVGHEAPIKTAAVYSLGPNGKQYTHTCDISNSGLP